MKSVNRTFLLSMIVFLVLWLCLTGCSGSSSSSASILLEVQFSENVSEGHRSTVLREAIDVIRHRLNAFGVADFVVEEEGDNRILVEVPDVLDVESVARLVSQTSHLEFKEIELKGSSNATLNDYVSDGGVGFFDTSVSGCRIFYASASQFYTSARQDPVAILEVLDNGTRIYTDIAGNPIDAAAFTSEDKNAICWMTAMGELNGIRVPLTSAYLKDATAVVYKDSPTGDDIWGVAMEWSSDGWTIFNSIAGRLYGKPTPQNELAIVLDNELISSPTVQASSYYQAQITRDFDSTSCQELAVELTSGSLPAALEVVSVTTK